jgi:hypothetical protein
MAWENLLAIRRLVSHPADRAAIEKLLKAAQRNLDDYTGDGVNDALLAKCLAQAEVLSCHARATLVMP